MNCESEAYLKHLRAQLQDLKASKSKSSELQDQISELEQNYLIIKQEKSENDAQLEESIKTHVKILEGIKSENDFMLKNLMDKQILNDNSFQILNVKKQELQTSKEQISDVNLKILSLNRSIEQTENKLSAGKLKLSQLSEDKSEQSGQISELRNNLKILNQQMTEVKMRTIEKEKDCLISEKKKVNLEETLVEKRLQLKSINGKLEDAKGGVYSNKDLLENKTKEIKEVKQLSHVLSCELKELSLKLTQEIENNTELEGLLNRKSG